MKTSGKASTALLWVLAIIITLTSVIYQRMTGPSYPKKGKVTIGESQIHYRLIRTHDIRSDARVSIYAADASITGEATYRRYKSNDEWTTVQMQREGSDLYFNIPAQPAAGKVTYNVSLIDAAGNKYELTGEPVTIRFKGHVPGFILFPHIIFMFSSMLIGIRAGLEALFGGNRLRIYAILAAATLFCGGILLGPIVQKYAFNAYWTGWPFGGDLTDNKTALSMILWIIAVWKSGNLKSGRKWVVIASVVQLAVYLIPHSVLGSEIDHTKITKP